MVVTNNFFNQIRKKDTRHGKQNEMKDVWPGTGPCVWFQNSYIFIFLFIYEFFIQIDLYAWTKTKKKQQQQNLTQISTIIEGEQKTCKNTPTIVVLKFIVNIYFYLLYNK